MILKNSYIFSVMNKSILVLPFFIFGCASQSYEIGVGFYNKQDEVLVLCSSNNIDRCHSWFKNEGDIIESDAKTFDEWLDIGTAAGVNIKICGKKFYLKEVVAVSKVKDLGKDWFRIEFDDAARKKLCE